MLVESSGSAFDRAEALGLRASHPRVGLSMTGLDRDGSFNMVVWSALPFCPCLLLTVLFSVVTQGRKLPLSLDPKAEDSSRALKSGSLFRLSRTLIVLGRVIIAFVFKSQLLNLFFPLSLSHSIIEPESHCITAHHVGEISSRAWRQEACFGGDELDR
jgi:hypothetical protein